VHTVRTLREGFAYQGEPSPHRGGKGRGEPTQGLSPLAFVNFLQNHDQIGNRPLGDRLTRLAAPAAYEAALAVLLLSPSPPLLFMGEEWGATEPFPFFCDFEGDLADAVRNGRRREFAEAYAMLGDEIPDPLSEDTVRSATLDWSAATREPGIKRLTLVQALLRARHQHVVPLMPHFLSAKTEAHFSGNVLTVTWRTNDRSYSLLANLAGTASVASAAASRWETAVWGETLGAELPPWSVFAGTGAA